jgi:hypothetical protein
MVTRSHVGLVALLSILLVGAPAFAADESNGVQQIEGGAGRIGGGVEEAAKGIGTTVVQGAKTAGERITTAENAAEPAAKRAWSQATNAAVSFGHSVRNFVALAAGAAWAESSPFVGRWHWNRAQSTLPPGEPSPNDLVSEISRADGSVTWSVTIVTPDDQPHVVTFDAAANGELHRVSSDTTASVRLSADALQVMFQGPAGRSDAQMCTVSADHRTMTCKGVLTDGADHTASYVDAYDRM